MKNFIKYPLILFIITVIFSNKSISQENINVSFDTTYNSLDSLNKINNELEKEDLWGFYLGYFPDLPNHIFASSGFSLGVTSESQSNQHFNLGWYFIFRKTFDRGTNSEPGGGISLGASLAYQTLVNQGTLLFKTGMGFGYSSYFFNVINIFSTEYHYKLSAKFSLSISLIEEISRFKVFLPPIINIGIIF